MPTPIAAVLRAYADAVFSKDPDAFADLYAPDVGVFDAWDAWSTKGGGAWRTEAEAWFAGLGEDRVVVTFADVAWAEGGPVVAVWGLVTYTAVGPDGETRRAMTNRLGWVLREVPSGWRVVHQHTSVPVALESGRVMPVPDAP